MGELSQTMTIIFCAIGAYGLGTLIADYDGPFNLFVKIRTRGKLFTCSTCLAFWFAIALSLLAGLGFVETIAVIGTSVALARHL